jgi:hypothetical protein
MIDRDVSNTGVGTREAVALNCAGPVRPIGTGGDRCE